MIRHLAILSLIGSSFAFAETTPDLLRFTNGDRLHGQYSGFQSPTELLWKRDDISDSVSFNTVNLHQLVLRGGDWKAIDDSISYVELINGDQYPGTVTQIDEEFVAIDTSCSGTLKIPRNAVSMIAPHPLGGPISYHGPFSPKGWTMANLKHPDAAEKAMDDNKKPDPEEPEIGKWIFYNSAWYWKSQQLGTALIRKDCMPGHAIVRFKIEWKNNLKLAVAMHADSSPAAEKDDDQRVESLSAHDSMMYPHLFGNSFVLQLNSNYIVLYRSAMNGENGPEVKRINVSSSRLRLGQNSSATVEVRSNREKGNLALYIDDAFVLQWAGIGKDAANPKKSLTQGANLGFLTQTSDSSIKISDIVIAEWNGMPDSARSIGVDHRDIVMMTNGLDRYAGEVISMSDNNEILLKGNYGEFNLPLNEVSEIRFAKNELVELPKSETGHLSVRMNPIGIISGKPVRGDMETLTLSSPFAGEITLNTKAAVMLDFNSKPSTEFDAWNIEP